MSVSHYRWSPSTWSVEKSWKYYHGVKLMRSRSPIIWFIANTHISFHPILLFPLTRYLSLCSKKKGGSFMHEERIILSIVISLHCETSSTFGWAHHWLIPSFYFSLCVYCSRLQNRTPNYEKIVISMKVRTQFPFTSDKIAPLSLFSMPRLLHLFKW